MMEYLQRCWLLIFQPARLQMDTRAGPNCSSGPADLKASSQLYGLCKHKYLLKSICDICKSPIGALMSLSGLHQLHVAASLVNNRLPWCSTRQAIIVAHSPSRELRDAIIQAADKVFGSLSGLRNAQEGPAKFQWTPRHLEGLSECSVEQVIP